ncbi:MAG TPA: AAA family ATPase [Actinophytocola sp.]|jgi:hypothetical protein|nr:AAA family ATPase [Actinophytocola sp.]
MTTAELIGRDHPAGVLRAEIDRAAESHGGLVLVTGEAGIGKTTLVTDGMDTARRAGALVLSGSCWDSGAAPGYWPWVQVIRALRRHGEDTSGLEVLLGERGPAAPTAGFEIYDAVTSALVAAAQRQPVVVVLDDLHWADAESVRLLEFVAQHTWFERLLLVGTYRDAEVEAADHPLAPLMLPLLARATTITLTGLDPAEVGALIARTTGDPPDDDVVAEVHRRTGGNPFFIEQTARLWHGGNALTAVAPGVRDAVRRRLALLPDKVTALLTDASVLGREFHRQVLAAVAGVPAAVVDRLLSEAVAARLVSALGDGRFAFAHDLVRETLYESLGSLDEDGARRRHASVVRALDRSPALAERIFPADRARHGYLAGDQVAPGVVVDLLMAAADDARRRMAYEEMVGHLRRGLERVAADDPRRSRMSLDLGVQYFHRDRTDEAYAALRTAADVALALEAPGSLVRVALTLWGYSGVRATLREELIRAAHARLIGGDAAGELDRVAQEVISHVIAHARSDNDDDALGFSLWTRHDTMWEPGNAAERLALTDELRTVAQRTGDVEMEMFATSLGWVAAIELGDPRFAGRFAAFFELAERNALPSLLSGAFIDKSIIAALRGRFAEAGVALDRAFTFVPGEDDLYLSYMGHQLRWSLLLVQGRFDELAELADRSAEAKYPHPALLAGITAATRGDGEEAARCLAEVGSVPGPFRAMLLRLQAQVAFLTRSPSARAAARAGLTPLAGGWLVGLYGCDIGGPVAYWLALVDAAESRVDSAVAGFRAALRAAEALGARPWVVEAKLGLALVTPADEAAALRTSAGEEAADLGIRHRATARAQSPPREFRFTGATWSLTMAGRTVHVPDAKGLRDLHVLLSAPGTEIPATRLLNPSGGAEVEVATSMSGDEVLDATARAAYRRRLSTLDEQIDTATTRGDDTRAARLGAERAALLDELRAAAGLGNRTRRLGDEAERARKTVTARIRDTLRKLDVRHPELAAHLRESVSTGATCCYRPDSSTRWAL